ncbi:beta strand repeat-containing protein [Psychroserpens sp.]
MNLNLKQSLLALLFLINITVTAQVGIGNTDPKAALDISATNVATPNNTDGILIPRIDEFPAVNPTAAQNGMLVFVTGNGTPTKGFYYWDQSTNSWITVTDGIGAQVIDDLIDGKSDISSVFLGFNAGFNDDGNDNKNVSIGYRSLQDNTIGHENTATGYRSLYLNTEGIRNVAIGTYSLNSNSTGGYNTASGFSSLYSNTTGSQNTANGAYSLDSNYTGSFNTANGSYSLYSKTSGNYNTASGHSSLNRNTIGSFNTAYGSSSLQFNTTGSSNVAIGYRAGYNELGSNVLYIENTDADEHNALIYGNFGTNNTTVGNFLRINGELQLGTTFANRYRMPTARGSANQILQTNGFGQVSFVDATAVGTDNQDLTLTTNTLNLTNDATTVDLSGYLDNTDNQNLTGATLTGTSLQIDVQNGASTTVDLSGLQDGTGTDNQDLTLATNTLSLTNDATTVDLSGYLDNTDNQNLTGATLTGTSLQIDIQNGSSTIVDLIGLQDGNTQNTLDQAYNEGGLGVGRSITATNGAVTIAGEDGLLITGTFGSGESATISGAGTRMFFNPRKSAFRAGYVESNNWNDNLIGDYSFATGYNNQARDFASMAFGKNTTASGAISTSFGILTGATGAHSVAFGHSSESSGTDSSAFGHNTIAASFGETAVGNYNALAAVSPNVYDVNAPSFTVGIGATAGQRRNGLEVFNNGKVRINSVYFLPTIAGTLGQIMKMNSSSQVVFADPTTVGTDNQNLTGATLTGTSLQIDIQNGTSTTVNLSSLQDGNSQNTLDQAYNEGGSGAGKTINAINGAVTISGEDGIMVKGLTGIGDVISESGSGSRMFFNPRIGAFRAGDVRGNFGSFDNSVWNQINVGSYSFAGGINTLASGEASTAFGTITSATGDDSFAIGNLTTASGDISTSMGANTVASGNYSTAMGFYTLASLVNETAIGKSNKTGSFGRLFVIGNGSDSSSRSNAFEVFNTGEVTINEEYSLPTIDGSTNQIMQTNGSGQVSFVDATSLGTDNQNLTGATLTGASLQIDIQNGASTTVDLAPMLPVDVATFAAARMIISANQSFTGNGWGKINFDTVSFDLTTNFNTTNTRFNVTTAGIYRINGSFHSNATSSSTSSFGIAVYVNGTLNKRVQMSHYGNGLIQRDVSSLIDLAASDKIEIYIYHTGAITINSNGGKTSFEIERIR